MADAYYQQAPGNQNLPIRPLKGMIRNRSGQLIPVGQFYTASGVVHTENGLRKAPGFRRVGAGDQFDETTYGIPGDIHLLYDSGTYVNYLTTSTSVMTVSPETGFTAVTDGADCWLDSEDNPLEVDEADVSSMIVPDGSSYTIVFCSGGQVAQITALGAVAPVTFDTGTGLTPPTYAKTCAYFGRRAWYGSPSDSLPNRLVWSDIDDPFNVPTINFLDFPTSFPIKRIEPLGNLLVVYFADAIYFGRPTNDALLPYYFTRIDVANAGLVGRRALVHVDDGHLFVSADDVYFLSASGGIERVDCPLVKELIRSSTNRNKIMAALDVENDCVVFGTNDSSEAGFNKLIFLNYKTKEWTMRALPDIGYVIAQMPLVSTNIWGASPTSDSGTMTVNGITVDVWKDAVAPDVALYDTLDSWNDFFSKTAFLDMFLIGADGYLNQSDEAVTFDFTVGYGVEVDLVSGDLDLNLPDIEKTVNRLTMKVEDIVPADVRFALYTSRNRGNAWTYQGDLVLRAGEDEGRVNFRATGSTFRFRLVSTSVVLPYTINEMVLRLRPRGLER